MFRDFHRHRALTLERQLLTTDHGYNTPHEIKILGIDKEYKECMHKTKDTFDKIRKKSSRARTVCCKFCIQLSILYEV